MLGTKVDNEYQWMSFKEVAVVARNFAAGAEALNLIPEIEADGTKFKLIGIKAKNRKEWAIIHLANMHIKASTVALYDTLGPDATKFIINQTEMATIGTLTEMIKGVLALKEEDAAAPQADQLMHRLKNIICFDDEWSAEDKAKATQLGITIYSFKEVVAKGVAVENF